MAEDKLFVEATEEDGDEVRMTLRANASVHGECARCLDPVIREETVDTEWTCCLEASFACAGSRNDSGKTG